MTGWAVVFGPCFGCGRLFGFNPTHVPSYRDPDTGEREPICATCIGVVNERRAAAGLDLWDVHPDAYEPAPAAEL